MDKDKQERLRFLEYQLLWSMEIALVLDEIEARLQEMKRIAEYALDVELSYSEGEVLNLRLIELKEDVIFLEKKLEMDFH
ncbi:hypothetical protein [Cytobacillus firmus]|uniref:hypothetical protein n=1 Tax=Cytobacillus firmus TaxID=1399 RepID=UPI0018CE98F8|nr:hypothetical protein [Cytobacillus firmus]MBG9657785.1 hypothetical protein [Cytobacillus firmus]MED1904779.1 hypothetical protein [Cytobacillus firmus]